MAWFDHKRNEVKIIPNAQGNDLTPSVVYLDAQGEDLVGFPVEEILNREEVDYTHFVPQIKRELLKDGTHYQRGDRGVTLVEVAGMVFTKLKQDAEKWFSAPDNPVEINEAVVTHPATFDVRDKEKIRQAAILAGFHTVHLISEPQAVAWACIAEGELGRTNGDLLVYDLGGGTFDLALLAYHRAIRQMEVRGQEDGVKELGSIDFDDALYRYCDEEARAKLRRKISSREGEFDPRFLEECRRCKEALTYLKSHTIKYVLDPSPESSERDFLLEVTRDKFQERIQALVESTIQYTRDFLEQNSNPKHEVKTLILAGGASQTPLVQAMLEQLADERNLQLIGRDRLKAAAKGAAYYAHILELRRARHTNHASKARQSAQHSISSHPEKDYQDLVKMAWLDGVLQPGEMRELGTDRKRLGLTEEQAAKIETEVMGNDRHTIFENLEHYRELVRIASQKRSLKEKVIAQLAEDAAQYGITAQGARKIEEEELGEDKETYFAK